MAIDVINGTLSERVARERDELLSAEPRIDIERDKALLEAYQETGGQPAVIRQATFFNKLCNEKTIFIDDNPIGGTLTQHKYGNYPFAEIGPRWMKKVDRLRLPLGFAEVRPEEKEWLLKSVELWKDRNIFNRTKDMVLRTLGVDIGTLQKAGVATEINPGGLISGIPDYGLVLNEGLNSIIASAQESQAGVNTGDKDGLKKWYFYEAVILCLNGLITLANRYAKLAREMAATEDDPRKKSDLERIAEACSWVPENPARNFFEAIQASWLVLMAGWFQSPNIGAFSPARFPQYIYPYYKKDKEAGRLTDAEAIELIQYYYLKIQSLGQVLAPFGFKYSQSRVAMQVSLGGLTPDGRDATNDVDRLCIEAKHQLNTPEPLLCLIYHDHLPEDFLIQCVDLIRTGIGQPAFYDANKILARSLYHRPGITVEEARNQAVIACVQDIIPGYSDGFWEGNINATKMLELVLNNGVDPVSGAELGVKTGDIEKFQSFEQLFDALYKQMEYMIPLIRTISRTAWNIERDLPVPYSSSLVHDCVETGTDLVDGGARYSIANGSSFVGTIDLANSLIAIRKLVYDEKKITLRELKEALDTDFEGHEDIQKMCLDAPKYGNGDEDVDLLARRLYDILWQLHQTYPDFLDRNTMPEAYSVASHGALGELTGALPNGRKARVALTDATVSPQLGTDRNGPTALIKSAATVIDTVKFGSNHFNMRFHPSAIEGPEGAQKFLALIKTYMDLGGYHVQFNCVSSDTLKEAQIKPDDFKTLIVRVAGFSAYFVQLDKIVQDEIIRRTELKI
ncbi:MAG: pyruvate formate lyase family protein [Dehalococcoidia bacterium]